MSFENKVKRLSQEVMNVTNHVFGKHKWCKKFGLKCTGKQANGKQEQNLIPMLKVHGFYNKIQEAIKYLSLYCDSLLHRKTNNAAESFNALICGNLGGRRINFSLKQQYYTRVLISVIQHNTQKPLSEVYKAIKKRVPDEIEATESRRIDKVQRTRKSIQSRGKKRRQQWNKSADKHYGPNCQKDDLPLKKFDEEKEKLFSLFKKEQANLVKIERDTKMQSESPVWHTLRKNRLTASNFGKACKWRITTSCATKVKEILYPPTSQYQDSKQMKYGLAQEKIAKEKLRKDLKNKIEDCGMFIDRTYPFLSASPDGLIDKDGILEVKATWLGSNLTAEQAIQEIKSLREVFNKNDATKLNTNHDYYFQIQGQLHITGRNYCLFVIHTPQSQVKIRVERDDKFWEKKMEKQLERFYSDCMLPEILDSRHNRNMPIRNPSYTQQAIENKKNKKSDKATDKTTNKRKINTQENELKTKRRQVDKTIENTNENEIEDSDEDYSEDEYVLTSDSDIEKVDENVGTNVDRNVNESDDDVIMGDIVHDPSLITERDNERLKQSLDYATIVHSEVFTNVYSYGPLTDQSMDLFIRVLQNHTMNKWNIQSIQYQGFLTAVDPVETPSIQILGGENDHVGHYRTFHYDTESLHVYDSLLPEDPRAWELTERETNYIKVRFPKLDFRNIIFHKMRMRQRDGVSCGIYAAAYATSIMLGENPADINYTTNKYALRDHFGDMCKQKIFSSFPRR